MADNEKYYYLRLKEDFFEDDAIQILEALPDGYLYSNILLKLYLKSLKFSGKLMFNERIPYNPTVLATITRHNVGTVEKALQIFKELGLIEILDNGAMYMLDIQNFIGKTSTEADRKRAYRERIEEEKRTLIGQKSGQISDKSTPEIEIEIEKDIDIEKKKEIKHKFGEFGHVRLKESESNRLISELGQETFDKCIKKLDEYIQETGKKYKDHNLTIRRWVIDAVKENKATNKPKATNKFNQFPQRDYGDMSEMEQRLLNRGKT